MSEETLNTLQHAEAVTFEVSGVKKLALAVIDAAIRDLLYIYHTGRLYDVDSKVPKYSLFHLRRSEPYRFLTRTTWNRDFWCMTAGLDADAVSSRVETFCRDQLSLEQFSRSYSSEQFKKGKM